MYEPLDYEHLNQHEMMVKRQRELTLRAIQREKDLHVQMLKMNRVRYAYPSLVRQVFPGLW